MFEEAGMSASEDARFAVGSMLTVDGGWTAQ